VPAQRAVRLPDGVGFDAGACLGIPAMTAHRAVFADGPVTGQTVLVSGGAGAVGSAAIQLAAWGGAAEVIATVSSEAKAAVARAAGASRTINYRTEEVAVPVDRIVEVDFGGNLAASLRAIKPNGVIAGYASRGDPEPKVPFRALMQKNVTLRAILVYSMAEAAKAAAMADITRALEAGALRPVIGERWPLERIADAHRAVEQGSVIGNIVLRLVPD
jgi:NADPH2:quinone reductase